MNQLDIILNCEGKFPQAKQLDTVTAIGRLPRGMVSGKSSVTVEITAPNGDKTYGQMSLEMLNAAVSAMNARDDEVQAGRLKD